MPTDAMRAEALHECHDCGLFQSMGALRPGQVAACERCGAVLRRRRRNSITGSFALAAAGLVLMVVSTFWPLMSIRLAGQERVTDLLHLPVAFEELGMPVLAIAVLATTVVAPFARLILTLGVIGGLRMRVPHGALVSMARLRGYLQPWAMIEVFLLGVFVAFTRLQAIATVTAGVALYTLIGLMVINTWAEAWIDEHALWEAIGERGPPLDATRAGPLIGCDACGLANHGQPGQPCQRCHTPLRVRRPQSLTRCWALLLTAAILYIPANLYPVLTVIRLGRGHPSTILGGVIELVELRMWPLAALVFLASILVPMLKLVGLAILLISVQRGAQRRLMDRTRLYRVVDFIGRWSMIDVFMTAILSALVTMGSLASVTPGWGVLAFCLVVILTMLAALSFDPRLTWDAAGENEVPELIEEPAATAVPA